MKKHQKEQGKPVKKSSQSPVHPSASTTLLQPPQSSQNLSQVSQPLRIEIPPIDAQSQARIRPTDRTCSFPFPSVPQHWQTQEKYQYPPSYSPLPSYQPSLPSQPNLSPCSDSSFFFPVWKVYESHHVYNKVEEQKHNKRGEKIKNKIGDQDQDEDESEEEAFLSQTNNPNLKNKPKVQSKPVSFSSFCKSSQKQQIIQNDDNKNKIQVKKQDKTQKDRDKKLNVVENKIKDKQVGSNIQKKQKQVKKYFDTEDQGNQQEYQDQPRKRIRGYYTASQAKSQQLLMQRINATPQKSQSKLKPQPQPQPFRRQHSSRQNCPPPSPKKQSSIPISHLPPPSSPISSPRMPSAQQQRSWHQNRAFQNMNFLGRKLREFNKKKEQIQINQQRETEREVSEEGLGEGRPKRFKVGDEEIYIDFEGLGGQRKKEKKGMMDLERQMERQMEMGMEMENQEDLRIKFGLQMFSDKELKIQIMQYKKYELEKKKKMEMEYKDKKNL